MQWILYFLIGAISVVAYFIIHRARQKTNPDILQIGTFLILTLTLIALAIYAFDTNRLVRLTQERWERESIVLAKYALGIVDQKGGKGKTGFILQNPSNLMLRAKVWCDFKVYGTDVRCEGGAYNGDIWTIDPGQSAQGWFEIEPLLKQRGKTVKEMIKDYSDEIRDKQLTLNLKIEFRNELGGERVLPSRKYYFVFNEWKWIPVLTNKEDW